MIRLVVVGAAGRMGRAIEAAVKQADELEIVGRVDLRANFPADGGVWTEDATEAVLPGRVVIEFSTPGTAVAIATVCASRGVPLVSGSTGLSPEEEGTMRGVASRVAVLRASNFSIGVAALRRALASALGAVPPSWDVEIIERHHRLKKDSPSGTALMLADNALAARGRGREALRHGRQGAVGPRTANEIGVHAVRGGTWVGDHTVILAGEGETLELRHVAHDRAAFAHGALAAARFVAGAKPGLYALDDVL